MFISKKYYNYNLLVLVYFHELKSTKGKWKLFCNAQDILILLKNENKTSITEEQKYPNWSKKSEFIPTHPGNVYR